MEIGGSSVFLMNKNSSTYKKHRTVLQGSLILLHSTEKAISVHCGEIDTVKEKVIKKWCSSFFRRRIILKLKMTVIDPFRSLFDQTLWQNKSFQYQWKLITSIRGARVLWQWKKGPLENRHITHIITRTCRVFDTMIHSNYLPPPVHPSFYSSIHLSV